MELSSKSKQIKKKQKKKKIRIPDNAPQPEIKFKDSYGVSNWKRMQELWKVVLCGSFVLAILSWVVYDLEVHVAFSFPFISSFILYTIILGSFEKKGLKSDKISKIGSNSQPSKDCQSLFPEEKNHNKSKKSEVRQSNKFAMDIDKSISISSDAKKDLHSKHNSKSFSTSVGNNSKVISKMKKNQEFKFNFDTEHITPDSIDYSTDGNAEGSSESERKITKAVAMDCEMVGTGPHGDDSIIARVSIVNSFGDCLYDEFVKPKLKVTDFRTNISGVRPSDLKNGKDLFEVQKDVLNIIEGRILVGHAIKHDLDVLFISHPRHLIRDTSLYKPFRDLVGGRTPALKKLTSKILGCEIQSGEHSSVEDAQAAMLLYLRQRHAWESHVKSQRKRRPRVIENSATNFL